MSAEKRAAADAFGSSQIVKRQKSDANLGNGGTVAVVNSSTQNGALIQAVSCTVKSVFLRRPPADPDVMAGPTHEWATSSHHGTDG